MKQILHIIALRTIRHSDRINILTAYSLESGRVALAVNAGKGPAASRMRALLMPLSMVECQADIKPGREVHTLFQPSAITPLHSLHTHPVKTSLAIFIAEILTALLRDGPADPTLWDYISASITVLDSLSPERLANYHVTFLYGLARLLGIAPDTGGFRRGMVFDMEAGHFRSSAPLHTHFLGATEAAAVITLSRLNYRNMHRWRMTRAERGRLLDSVLEYYTLHYAPLTALKSLDIVRLL